MSNQPKSIDIALEMLGDPREWKMPDGYKNSLALCVLDSIWSIGIRYQTVLKVLGRYLKARGYSGIANAQRCTDGTSHFLDWYRTLGEEKTPGEAISKKLNNWNRTSSRGGKLKGSAVLKAFLLLESLNVETTQDLISRADEIESRWKNEVPGQSSGISWKYVLMLAGQSGVKPDRMLYRFMERVGVESKTLTPEDFVKQIVQRIGMDKVDATAVDHRIWSVERARRVGESSLLS
jgi:hypothetical protein